MKTNEVAEALGVSRHTIIDWSKRYAEFLSDDAAPPKGTTRSFNLRDLKIMRRIHELTRSKTHEEIYEIVEGAVADGDFEGVVIDPGSFEGEGSVAMTLAEARQIIGRYEIALGNERARAEKLERELKEAQATIAQLRSEGGRLEGQLEEIRRQDSKSDDLIQKISELQREIGRLEAQLEMERQRIKANHAEGKQSS